MNDHPTTDRLRAFLEGGSSARAESAGLHAERCPACLAKLNGLVEAAVESAPALPPVAGLSPPGVPGYEALEVLGRGGSGVVYKARQSSLGAETLARPIPD